MNQMVGYLLEYFPLQFVDAVKNNEYLWFSASEYNGLFRIKPDSGHTEYMGMFPGESINALWLHSTVISYEDKLYFMPWHSKNIDEYSIKKNIHNVYSISDRIAQMPYRGAVQKGQYIYFWEENQIAILKFDLYEKRIDKIKLREGVRLECAAFKRNFLWEQIGKKYLFISYAVAKEGIYITSVTTNMILKIDFVQQDYFFYYIDEVEGIRTICNVGDYFILTDLNERLIWWKPDEGIFENHRYENIGLESVSYCERCGDIIYYSLYNDRRLLCFNIFEKKFWLFDSDLSDRKEDYWRLSNRLIQNNIFTIDHELWGIERWNSNFWKLENNNKYVKKITLHNGVEKFATDRTCGYYMVKENLLCRETKKYLFHTYLNMVCLKNRMNVYKEEEKGQVIWKHLVEKGDL